ncbi:hypothetical protein [Nostoc sp. CALU 546]
MAVLATLKFIKERSHFFWRLINNGFLDQGDFVRLNKAFDG